MPRNWPYRVITLVFDFSIFLASMTLGDLLLHNVLRARPPLPLLPHTNHVSLWLLPFPLVLLSSAFLPLLLGNIVYATIGILREIFYMTLFPRSVVSRYKVDHPPPPIGELLCAINFVSLFLLQILILSPSELWQDNADLVGGDVDPMGAGIDVLVPRLGLSLKLPPLQFSRGLLDLDSQRPLLDWSPPPSYAFPSLLWASQISSPLEKGHVQLVHQFLL